MKRLEFFSGIEPNKPLSVPVHNVFWSDLGSETNSGRSHKSDAW